ncbi:hypothetical protein LTR27_010852 [Elasticomyces elasticus]|nr:hypothetical protein LTR27_010852 [Elasticomyces elasticus]
MASSSSTQNGMAAEASTTPKPAASTNPKTTDSLDLVHRAVTLRYNGVDNIRLNRLCNDIAKAAYELKETDAVRKCCGILLVDEGGHLPLIHAIQAHLFLVTLSANDARGLEHLQQAEASYKVLLSHKLSIGFEDPKVFKLESQITRYRAYFDASKEDAHAQLALATPAFLPTTASRPASALALSRVTTRGSGGLQSAVLPRDPQRSATPTPSALASTQTPTELPGYPTLFERLGMPVFEATSTAKPKRPLTASSNNGAPSIDMTMFLKTAKPTTSVAASDVLSKDVSRATQPVVQHQGMQQEASRNVLRPELAPQQPVAQQQRTQQELDTTNPSPTPSALAAQPSSTTLAEASDPHSKNSKGRFDMRKLLGGKKSTRSGTSLARSGSVLSLWGKSKEDKAKEDKSKEDKAEEDKAKEDSGKKKEGAANDKRDNDESRAMKHFYGPT